MRGQKKWIGIMFAGALACAYGQWLNYPAPGTPRTRDGKPNLSAPPPCASNGKPDLSGLWLLGDLDVRLSLADADELGKRTQTKERLCASAGRFAQAFGVSLICKTLAPPEIRNCPRSSHNVWSLR